MIFECLTNRNTKLYFPTLFRSYGMGRTLNNKKNELQVTKSLKRDNIDN